MFVHKCWLLVCAAVLLIPLTSTVQAAEFIDFVSWISCFIQLETNSVVTYRDSVSSRSGPFTVDAVVLLHTSTRHLVFITLPKRHHNIFRRLCPFSLSVCVRHQRMFAHEQDHKIGAPHERSPQLLNLITNMSDWLLDGKRSGGQRLEQPPFQRVLWL